jgi:hypothetical protein
MCCMGKLSRDGKGAFDTRLNSFIGLHEMGKVDGWRFWLQHSTTWTQDGQYSVT